MIDFLTTKDIVYAVAILLMAGWTAYKELREMRLTKRFNLDGNPERCQKHSDMISRLDERVKSLEEDVHDVKDMLRGK